MQRTISQSEIKTWLDCPRKHWFRYVREISPKKTPFAFIQGTVFHDVLAAYYAGEVDELIHAVVNELAGVEETVSIEGEPTATDDWDKGEYLAARWRGVYRAYAAQYPRDEFSDVEILEHRYDVPFVFEDSRIDWHLNGRFDGIVCDKKDVRWLLEHKTAAGYVVETLMNLRMDFQVSFYLMICDLLEANGRLPMVSGALYNIVVKPTLRPKSVWLTRYSTGETIQTDTKIPEREARKQSLMIVGQSKVRQSPEEYEERIFEAMTSKPIDYFFRDHIVRSPNQKEMFREDLIAILNAISDGSLHPNYNHCRHCTYRRLCSARPDSREDLITEFYGPPT